MTVLSVSSYKVQRKPSLLFQAYLWTQEQKGALALTSLIYQATSSSTLLCFCGLSHHTDHPKFLPFVPWILWLTLATCSLNTQPPKHLSWHVCYQHFSCLFVGSLCVLFFSSAVGLRVVSVPSVTTYTFLYVYVRGVQVQAGLGEVQMVFPSWRSSSHNLWDLRGASASPHQGNSLFGWDLKDSSF